MSERRDFVPFAPRTAPRPACPAVVRRAVEADVDDVAVLAATVSTDSIAVWQERLTRLLPRTNGVLLVARMGTALAGYVRVGHVVPGPEDTAPEGEYLVGLAVAPAWRRQGVAEALVQAAAAYAAERADVLWSTYDEDNLASAHLHAGLGFRVVWRGDVGFPGQPPGTRWVLVQRLLAQ